MFTIPKLQQTELWISEKKTYDNYCYSLKIKIQILKGIFFLFCLIIGSNRYKGQSVIKETTSADNHPFTIYQYIPFHSFVKEGQIMTFEASKITKNEWFDKLGIHTTYVVYHSLDNSVLEQTSLKAAALSIISLDLEDWSFSDPKTPQRIANVLKIMHQYHPTVPVGVYGAAPVNTFGWGENREQKYNKLNPRYQLVADAVDIISPVLYSYQPNMKDWDSTARYDMYWAHRYNTKKPIIPYLSIDVKTVDGGTRELTYDEMMHELKFLKALKANGCIVWASSHSAIPLDQNRTGWLRAMIDFARDFSY